MAHVAAEFLEVRQLLSSTLLGQSLFPADNPWNQNISQAPVAANSAAVISHIGASIHVHPDWGADNPANGTAPLYGIPFNIVHGNTTPQVNVVIDNYPSESDIAPVPIPANAAVEGDYQNGPNPNGGGNGPNQRGDSHLIVWDEDNNIAYELYGVTRPTDATLFPNSSGVELPHTDGLWHAAQETVWNMNTNTFRTLGETSADAAGLSILAGLVRPDEGLPISQGGQGVITHALRMTLPGGDINPQYIYPASHEVNKTPGASNLPLGSRLRLANTPAVNALIANMPPESQIIARAMQQYGLIVADVGSAMYVTGSSASVDANNNIGLTWNTNDIFASNGLKVLTASDFEVVNLQPVVTGLSSSSGAAGNVLTITGQNFSGAAGHLSVLFGSTPATSVTVVSDTQLSVVVPGGTGTVDVTVQSGQNQSSLANIGSSSDNVNAPIFGYGTSATTAADRFTFTGQSPLTDVTPVQTFSAVEGNSTGLVTFAQFTDSIPAVATDFTATVNWGGTVIGVPTVSVTFVSSNGATSLWNVTGSAVYAEPGAYTPSVKITDNKGNEVDSGRSTFTVADAALTDTTVTATRAATEEKTTGSITLATFTDADPSAPATDFSASVNWNGPTVGTPTVSIALVSRTAAVSTWKVTGSAVYAEPGLYKVGVTVTDVDGGTVTTSNTSVQVADGVLSDLTVAKTLNSVEGSGTGSIVLATFSDANPVATLADYSLSVAWGGMLLGTPAATVQLVSRSATVSTWNVVGSAVYAEKGLYTAVAKITDVDGSSLTSARTKFNVADAPLTDTTPAATVNAVEGNSVGTVTLATFTDGDPTAPVADFKATVNWGGTLVGVPTVTVSLVGTTATTSTWKVTSNAVYAEPGAYVPVITVTDRDGSSFTTGKTTFNIAEGTLTDATALITRGATEGKNTGVVSLATFTDADPWAPATDFSASVNWGGALVGTPTASVIFLSRTATASTWRVIGSAVYAEAGLYNLGVTVKDVDGASASTANTSFKVADAPLSDTTTVSTINASRGIGFSNVVLTQFTDGNPFAQASDFDNLTVNWGGPVTGPSFNLVFVSSSSAGSVWQVVGSATYTADGTFTATVTIPDIDGLTLISKRTTFNVTG